MPPENPQQADDFRAAFDVPPNVPIYVYDSVTAGVLDNGGERLTIARSSTLVAAPISVDEVRYDDEPPWPSSPDGEGSSLSKIVANAFGNDPANWSHRRRYLGFLARWILIPIRP